jgi:hypothetical protein
MLLGYFETNEKEERMGILLKKEKREDESARA